MISRSYIFITLILFSTSPIMGMKVFKAAIDVYLSLEDRIFGPDSVASELEKQTEEKKPAQESAPATLQHTVVQIVPEKEKTFNEKLLEKNTLDTPSKKDELLSDESLAALGTHNKKLEALRKTIDDLNGQIQHAERDPRISDFTRLDTVAHLLEKRFAAAKGTQFEQDYIFDEGRARALRLDSIKKAPDDTTRRAILRSLNLSDKK